MTYVNYFISMTVFRKTNHISDVVNH